MKRLLALLAGGLGLGALLRRRARSAPALSPGASPADDLRAKLAASRDLEADRAENEGGETTVDAVDDVAARRAGVHERARQALDELRD
jgi:hypothetical protein